MNKNERNFHLNVIMGQSLLLCRSHIKATNLVNFNELRKFVTFPFKTLVQLLLDAVAMISWKVMIYISMNNTT